jgi:hypothetical protein
MRERGQYQLQLMKTRSSSGVGQKIELEFNVETLRITDPNPDANTYKAPQPSPNDLMNRLKTTSNVSPQIDPNSGEIEPETKKVVADVQGAKLKALLNSLKK